jgi:hypothetical protein
MTWTAREQVGRRLICKSVDARIHFPNNAIPTLVIISAIKLNIN